MNAIVLYADQQTSKSYKSYLYIQLVTHIHSLYYALIFINIIFLYTACHSLYYTLLFINSFCAMFSARSYTVNTCFACQDCLLCGAKCNTTACVCDKTQKPKTKQKAQNGVKAAFGRSFVPSSVSKKSATIPLQVDFLKKCNERWGYSINFNNELKLYLCSTCHSKYERCKKELTLPWEAVSQSKSADSTSDTASSTSYSVISPLLSKQASIMSVDNEIPSPTLISVKLIVKCPDGTAYPAKYCSLRTSDFNIFRHDIESQIKHIIQASDI